VQLTGYRKIVPKTAAYTIDLNQHRPQTRFTNRGAGGSVTFTLPTPASNQRVGLEFEFLGVADQTVIVSAGAGKGVAFNNAACASLAFQTGGQKIGALITATWDGTSWHLVGSTIGVTYTVA
jgi:hypothetical protein